MGTAVYYAGSVVRDGANSQYHAVDSRIVGRKPASLDWAAAAALPLTALTAYECLFDRLRIPRDGSAAGQALFILNGAGGVGSIAIQLAKALAPGLRVIASAGRPDSFAWVTKMGADAVISHAEPWKPQLEALGQRGGQVNYILLAHDTASVWGQTMDAVAPLGAVTTIVLTPGAGSTLDVNPMRAKVRAAGSRVTTARRGCGGSV